MAKMWVKGHSTLGRGDKQSLDHAYSVKDHGFILTINKKLMKGFSGLQFCLDDSAANLSLDWRRTEAATVKIIERSLEQSRAAGIAAYQCHMPPSPFLPRRDHFPQ